MSGWRVTAANSPANCARSGQAVAEGSKSLLALAVVVGVAVLREGSEVVLFLYGVLAADGGFRLERGARRLRSASRSAPQSAC